MLRRAALALCLAAVSGSAVAAPATPEEAARLQALFETYLGHPAAGGAPSVTVKPEGDDYKATLDLGRLAAPLHAFGFDLVASEPYVTTLTPLPDGTWRVRRGPFPQFGFTTKKGLTYSVQISSRGSDAIFDPKLKAFTHVETELSGNRTSVTMGDHSQRTEITETGKQVLDSKGTSPDDVTSVLHQGDTDIRYNAHTEPAGTADPVGDIAATVASSSTDATVAHQRGAALLDLWAFLVAHPSRDQLVAEQAKLKSLATAIVPYASSFDGRVHADTLDAKTAQGGGKVASFDEVVSYGDEGLTLSVAFKGFQLTLTNPLPDWIVAMIPTNLEVNLVSSKLDLSKAVRVLIDGADIAKDDVFPAPVVAKAIAALAPVPGPDVTLKPSIVANKTMTLAFVGGFSSSGAGRLKVEAKGLDDEIAVIGKGAADDATAVQAVQALTLAKALAVTAPDGRLSWDIATGPGGTTVNGKPLQ